MSWVYLGCRQGNVIQTVATKRSGVNLPIIGVVGDQVVVAGSGMDSVRVATLSGGCPVNP